MSDSTGSNYKAELEGIKAPLGVILYLIRRDNIDIYDIPIAKITKDYLAYLDQMDSSQLDLAGEFFVLAATLMRIKAQMLLRRDDEEDDPREELVRNLLEYKKMAEAARQFHEMEDERSKVFARPVPQNEKEFRGEPVFELNLYEVMRAFREIMTEFEGGVEREIDPEVFTVEEQIEAIIGAIERDGQVSFREVFAGSSSRLEVVVTFIAMLEMMKRALITARQDKMFGEIWLYKAEPVDESEAEAADNPGENTADDPGSEVDASAVTDAAIVEGIAEAEPEEGVDDVVSANAVPTESSDSSEIEKADPSPAGHTVTQDNPEEK